MEDEAWSLSVKRHLSLSLYHYLLTAGLSSGQISKSICPRFHSENREKEKEEIKGELSFSQRKGGNGKEWFVGTKRKEILSTRAGREIHLFSKKGIEMELVIYRQKKRQDKMLIFTRRDRLTSRFMSFSKGAGRMRKEEGWRWDNSHVFT